ncbi:MAG: outer membrane protein assembly factor BamE [Thiothrix sp.]|uniref:outer membrane protein assembly factor BamE n=1 Tax=Thiothrix sp. TaxID=1032 RepID=UPI00261E8979|nr:outer membrane protein assembly factor BamE [Thiothrix sp.]MDD5392146.1 outer membrane protein assembly factor BamE [Thiothrix sp.]
MIKHLISLTLAAALLGGCSFYKMEIQQGNRISSEELAMVHPGMGAAQVQAILGTPLMADDFHKDRWDYVFYLKSPNGKVERNGVTVFFQNGVVRNVTQDPAPTN